MDNRIIEEIVRISHFSSCILECINNLYVCGEMINVRREMLLSMLYLKINYDELYFCLFESRAKYSGFDRN